MNKNKIYLWLNEAASQFIEGACDSFIAVAGGGAVASLEVSPKQLAATVVIGGAIYVAAFLKKNPTPMHYILPVPDLKTASTTTTS